MPYKYKVVKETTTPIDNVKPSTFYDIYKYGGYFIGYQYLATTLSLEEAKIKIERDKKPSSKEIVHFEN